MKIVTQSIKNMPEGSVVSAELRKLVLKLGSQNLLLLLCVEGNLKPPYIISTIPSMLGDISAALVLALGGLSKCRLILSRGSETGFEPEILAIGHEWLDTWVSIKSFEKKDETSCPELVRQQLEYINSKRAIFGQPVLDPIKAGWGAKDIEDEARRLHWHLT